MGFWEDLGGACLPIRSFKGDLGGISGLSLGDLGVILGVSWGILEASWGYLGGS